MVSERTVLKNCKILNGTGNPWYKGDIVIEKEKIVEISTSGTKFNREDNVVNVEGDIVCPGFIDIHTHSDTSFLKDKYAYSKICQGITTEVIGNCGISCAPLVGEGGKSFWNIWSNFFGNIEITWETVQEYLSQLEKNKLAQNVAPLVGHSTIRACVLGYARRPANAEEREKMGKLLKDAFNAGVFGISLGYRPGEWADDKELFYLAKIVSENDGFLAHDDVQLTSESENYDEITEKLRRFIRVGERSDVRIQISHVKCVGPVVIGRAGWIVDLIDKARERGVDVKCDLYGYTVGGADLVHLTPDFLMEATIEVSLQIATEKAVQDEYTRLKVLNEIKEKFKFFGGPNLFRIRICPSNPSYIGKTLSDVAEELDQKPEEVILDFLCSGNKLNGQWEVMAEKDVIKLMKHPTAMICSDAKAISIPLKREQETVHPRTFGAFPRILKWYVSDLGVLDLSEAVRKMTSLPAQQIGLFNRGLIKEGYNADITVFNPKEVRDRATYTEPYQLPKGIRYVFVNGVLSVEEGKYNKTLAGRVLRKNKV